MCTVSDLVKNYSCGAQPSPQLLFTADALTHAFSTTELKKNKSFEVMVK